MKKQASDSEAIARFARAGIDDSIELAEVPAPAQEDK
jgi:hypothetical protein